MIWKRKSIAEINDRIFTALNENVNYKNEAIIGVPASHLDEQVFSQEVSFIRDAPFLSTLVQNPNHIGCHTMGTSENFFSGTQELEREVIAICAEDILHAQPEMYDGYITSGGTEANLQAIWIYRNYFMRMKRAQLHEIALIFSEDSHYSMIKAANMFCLNMERIPVDSETREIKEEVLAETLDRIKENGVKHVIVVANMMTTLILLTAHRGRSRAYRSESAFSIFLSKTLSTCASSWPRLRITPPVAITLYMPWRARSFGRFSIR